MTTQQITLTQTTIEAYVAPGMPSRRDTEEPPDQFSTFWEPFSRSSKLVASSPERVQLPSDVQDGSTFLLLGDDSEPGHGFRPTFFRNGKSTARSQKNDTGAYHGVYQGYPSARKMRWTRSQICPQGLRTACFILHVGLVLLHCILLGIYIPHLEHRTLIPLGFQSTAWSTALPALSQAFVTLYTTSMLVLTQQLSLRRNLFTRQTLTATHDKSSAWQGLGSALLNTWRQIAIPASVWGVTSILLYLASISTLHISTPALFTLEPFNNTVHTRIVTTRTLPNQDVDTSDSITPVYHYFTQAAAVLPLIGQYSQLSTVGLHGNIVYDVLSNNRGVGNVTVNSTTFDVSCDALPNPRINGNAPEWNVTTDPLPGPFNQSIKSDFQVSLIAPNVVKMPLKSPSGDCLTCSGGNRVIFYSSVQFIDSRRGNGSRVTLSLNISDPSEQDSLQVMACRFSSNNGTSIVDAQTKVLVNPSPRKTSSTWGVPQPPTSFSENSTELITIMDWNSALGDTSSLLGTTSLCGDPTNCPLLTALEQFVIQGLGIKPDIDPVNDPQPRPQLELYQLESALENLTAALQWSTTQMNPNNASGSTLFDMAFNGTALVSEPQLVSRLKLNAVPLAVGLAASTVLLILAIMLVGKVEEDNAEVVDSAGILQLMWLLRNRPDLFGPVSQVDMPTPNQLRAAGMILVRLAGEVDYRGYP